MEGEFRGWLIPSSSLSSAVGNFQRISSLLVGPLVCRKRRSFSSIVKLAQVAFSVSIALDCFRSIGRFFVTHSERLFNPTGRGRGKILVAHLGERPCRGRNSKVLISRFDPGVKWAQFNCHKSSELHHVAIWSICWSQAELVLVLIETGTMKNLKVSTMPAVIHLIVPLFLPGQWTNPFPAARNLLPVTVRMLDRAWKSGQDPGKIGESWQLNAKVRDFFTFVYRCGWLHMLQIDVPCSALLCASYRLTWIDWGWGSRGMCLIGLKFQRLNYYSKPSRDFSKLVKQSLRVYWIYTLLDPAMLAII